MSNFLSSLGSILSGFGAGVKDPSFAFQEAAKNKEAEDRRQLGNIFSMQSIPAFARPGGAEPDSAQNIRNIQLQQLGQLGTPQALEMLGKLSPMNQSPEKQQALGYLSNILSQKYGLPAEQVNAMLLGGIDPATLGKISMADLDRRKAEADILETQNKAAYYLKGGSTGDVPSPIQIANKIMELRAAGRAGDADLLERTAKISPKGYMTNPLTGALEPIPGYVKGEGDISKSKQAGKEAATIEAIAPKALEEKKVALDISTRETMPLIADLLDLNAGTIDSPWAGAFQPITKMTAPEKAKALDLMQQARLEIAAPLAKQLGVNPTDKDFQASLDRIFDVNSSKPSRQAQIEALIKNTDKKRKAFGLAPLTEERVPTGDTLTGWSIKPVGGR